MSKPVKQRVKEHRERMKAKGYVQVHLWVPSHQVENLKKFAKSLDNQLTII